MKNIDVDLEPLIDELEELCRGIEIIDLSRSPSTSDFFLKAMLMWTMHDFLGYGEC